MAASRCRDLRKDIRIGHTDCGSGPVICGAGVSGARHSVFVFNSPQWILLPGIYPATSKSLCIHSFLWQAVSQLNNTYCLVLPVFSYPEAGWIFPIKCYSRLALDPAHTQEKDGWVDRIWSNVAVMIRCTIICRPQAGCVLGAETQLLTCPVVNMSHVAVCITDTVSFREWTGTGEDGHNLGSERRTRWEKMCLSRLVENGVTEGSIPHQEGGNCVPTALCPVQVGKRELQAVVG